jgi:hypothetical protein
MIAAARGFEAARVVKLVDTGDLKAHNYKICYSFSLAISAI